MSAQCEECKRTAADGALMELQCGCSRGHGLCHRCLELIDGSLRLLYFRARCPKACHEAPVYRWGNVATAMVKLSDLARMPLLTPLIPREGVPEAIAILDLLQLPGAAEMLVAGLKPKPEPRPRPRPERHTGAPGRRVRISLMEILWFVADCVTTGFLLWLLYGMKS